MPGLRSGDIRTARTHLGEGGQAPRNHPRVAGAGIQGDGYRIGAVIITITRKYRIILRWGQLRYEPMFVGSVLFEGQEGILFCLVRGLDIIPPAFWGCRGGCCAGLCTGV